MANQIELKGPFQHCEAVAAGTITPGHLIKLDSAAKVVVHATEAGFGERAFAKEDALQGKTTADNYSSADLVSYCLGAPGNELQAILKAGENVAIGEQLISAADGSLIAVGSVSSGVTVKQIIAVALAALDLSGSGAVNTLLAVRIL